MKRAAPFLWLAVIGLAAAYLAVRFAGGIAFESNILALLPREARDVSAQNAQDRITQSLSRRVVFLIGSASPEKAVAAAGDLSSALTRSGMIASLTSRADPAALQHIGAAYYAYRAGLLSPADRAALMAGNGGAIVARAQGILYGPAGFANARLIAHDPFFLLPNFLLNLPMPQSRLTPDNGFLTVRDGAETYVLVGGELAGDPYALSFEDRFDAFVSMTMTAMKRRAPDLVVLRTGAVFYAHDSAKEAMDETSIIGLASLIGTLGLILFVFRGLRPLLLGFAAIGAGVLGGFVATLLIFGQIHIIALLFGVSLIGISVDYSLQYFCEYFDDAAQTPQQRMARVRSGIVVGVATTLIGYCTLLLAPFPGLRQVAVFSFVGLAATVLTVLLWYPALDTKNAPSRGRTIVALAAYHWRLWEAPSLRWPRFGLIFVCVAIAGIGCFRFRTDDDVRHLQSLSPDLRQQERTVERLTGSAAGTEFLLVRGTSEEAVLETEERAADVLAGDRKAGALAAYTAISQYAPSIARQKDNRVLVQNRLLSPYLTQYRESIGFSGTVDPGMTAGVLTPTTLPRIGPLASIATLDVSAGGQPAHVILLQGVTDPARVSKSISGLADIRVVSLVDDWTRLFADYRRYAIALLAISAALMYPLLAWRYGLIRGARILGPSLAAVVLAPPLAALAGVSFTFFNAMALILVLSIGVDYSVFCAETSGVRKPVTALAIALAALSSLLSFGMLAFSKVFAVHAFGMTMLIGICLAFLFAPAAGDARKKAA
jgi:predicted exporter